jgi:hypothetical protein
MPYPRKTAEQMVQHLLTNVYKKDDCLEWAGSTMAGDLPMVMWNRKRYLAKRLLMELLGNKVSGMVVWNRCGNKLCMNPDHIIVGRRRQMVKEITREGKMVSGARRSLLVAMSRVKTARLPITEAPAVFRMRAEGMSFRQIGLKYQVTPSAVGHAIEAWRRAGVSELTTRMAA